MTRRPAVTLIEVLISMFIMAIGMLALLVLFPLGAVSMGQALKDDRCASTAAMAENVAIAMNLRQTTTFGATGLAYVDFYGALMMTAPFNTSVGGIVPPAMPTIPIPRVSPASVTSTQLADRLFSLPDDITFLENGLANTTTGVVDRGRNYSYAYLLRQSALNLVQLYVVVYSGRPVNTLSTTTEWAFPAAVISTNAFQIGVTGTTAKRGGWILDTNGNFYRITNIAESGGNTVLETQQNIQGAPAQIIIMDNVAEVFDKGTSWCP